MIKLHDNLEISFKPILVNMYKFVFESSEKEDVFELCV